MRSKGRVKQSQWSVFSNSLWEEGRGTGNESKLRAFVRAKKIEVGQIEMLPLEMKMNNISFYK